MPESPQSDNPSFSEDAQYPISGTASPAAQSEGDSREGFALEEPELDAALQLLVERAQYITGATGTALALPHGDEMVCRASAGSSAPAVGARLQVLSGITGESITRRQLLRCDNAETDPRVNLEACRALGIASIVVLPMLRGNGEIRGLFELFSDHPYAFEERDLIALERMADLTTTALDLAEQRYGAIPAPARAKQSNHVSPLVNISPEPPATAPSANASPTGGSTATPAPSQPEASQVADPTPAPTSESPTQPSAHPPDTGLHVQKCASCGFPVSEGRALCLDCDKLEREKLALQRFNREKAESENKPAGKDEAEKTEVAVGRAETNNEGIAETLTAQPPDDIPAFLANSLAVKESWMANHVNLLAVIVVVLGILVFIVVFR